MKKVTLLFLLLSLTIVTQAQRDPNNPQARPTTPTRTEPTRTTPTRTEPAPTRTEPTRTAPTRTEPTQTSPTRTTPTRESRSVVAETATGGAVANQGISGAMHQKHLKQIVFTEDYIEKDEMSDGALVSNVTVFAPLTMRCYMDNSFTNFGISKFPSASLDDIRANTWMQIVWYLDGQKVSDSYKFNNYLDDSELDSYTTFSVPIFEMKRGEISTYPTWDQFVLDAGHLIKKGSHKIKMELYDVVDLNGGGTVGPLATGEITMNFPTDLINPADPRVCLPANYKTDAGMEAKMMAVFKAQGFAEVPQRAIIQSEWETVRHPVTEKIIGRTCWGAISSKLGSKCMYQQFKFMQEGADGKYASTSSGVWKIVETGAQPEVPCGCMR